VRRGDRVTVLTPHGEGVRSAWQEEGVAVTSFRYAPRALEVLGYSRSLRADEKLRPRAALVAPLYAVAARSGLRQELNRHAYDLVHAHWVVPNGVIAAASMGSIPLAIGLHGSDVFLAERGGVRRLVRWSLRRTALLTGCSPELVERVRVLGLTHDRWRVIPYGVDSERFSPDRERRGCWRQRLGISPRVPVLLSVGRMATKKGFHVLLACLPELMERHPTAQLILAGAGDRLGEFEAAARRWARRVHFPGAVAHDQICDLYRTADLFVLPAVHDPKGNVDGLPNVILEAMASALPVVASNISGIPLAVRSGSEGLLVPEGDVAALTEALDRLLAVPETARQLGAAARRRVESELTWDAVAARYRRAYLQALEPRGTTRRSEPAAAADRRRRSG
jgi:glycosyltransferase involved in cell wall biosynthesis